ncbi:carboxypeptidase regulatory-like domain-containing protein [Candidatus Woesearchaeota archaeon]|nr:carboxypeptidase regulatory-like domain-containing protein [Candidatus Woesearchaeota archaeon]
MSKKEAVLVIILVIIALLANVSYAAQQQKGFWAKVKEAINSLLYWSPEDLASIYADALKTNAKAVKDENGNIILVIVEVDGGVIRVTKLSDILKTADQLPTPEEKASYLRELVIANGGQNIVERAEWIDITKPDVSQVAKDFFPGVVEKVAKEEAEKNREQDAYVQQQKLQAAVNLMSDQEKLAKSFELLEATESLGSAQVSYSGNTRTISFEDGNQLSYVWNGEEWVPESYEEGAIPVIEEESGVVKEPPKFFSNKPNFKLVTDQSNVKIWQEKNIFIKVIGEGAINIESSGMDISKALKLIALGVHIEISSNARGSAFRITAEKGTISVSASDGKAIEFTDVKSIELSEPKNTVYNTEEGIIHNGPIVQTITVRGKQTQNIVETFVIGVATIPNLATHVLIKQVSAVHSPEITASGGGLSYDFAPKQDEKITATFNGENPMAYEPVNLEHPFESLSSLQFGPAEIETKRGNTLEKLISNSERFMLTKSETQPNGEKINDVLIDLNRPQILGISKFTHETTGKEMIAVTVLGVNTAGSLETNVVAMVDDGNSFRMIDAISSRGGNREITGDPRFNVWAPNVEAFDDGSMFQIVGTSPTHYLSQRMMSIGPKSGLTANEFRAMSPSALVEKLLINPNLGGGIATPSRSQFQMNNGELFIKSNNNNQIKLNNIEVESIEVTPPYVSFERGAASPGRTLVKGTGDRISDGKKVEFQFWVEDYGYPPVEPTIQINYVREKKIELAPEITTVIEQEPISTESNPFSIFIPLPTYYPAIDFPTRQPQPRICGDGILNVPEQCESPNTNDNPFCVNNPILMCLNRKTAIRDAYGKCNSGCSCQYDSPASVSCIKGLCGANCSNNNDCATGTLCSRTSCLCIAPPLNGLCGDGIIQSPNNDSIHEECDGDADEILNDTGFCKIVRKCVDCKWQPLLDSSDSQFELCDGIDNNCNSLIDENIQITPSQNEEGYCNSQVGVCYNSKKRCGGLSGFAECSTQDYNYTGQYEQVEALCDNLDNDCDGSIDEGCPCVINSTKSCGQSNFGVCKLGVQNCTEQGVWGLCQGAIYSESNKEAVCNSIDDDCDGIIDENLKNRCGECGQLPEEVCDYIDNDCDAEMQSPTTKCTQECVGMWMLQGAKCIFNECGSGCGPDNVDTFKTEVECKIKSMDSERICPQRCVGMWMLQGAKCIFNECGSGCGPDNVDTFKTEVECSKTAGQFSLKSDKITFDKDQNLTVTWNNPGTANCVDSQICEQSNAEAGKNPGCGNGQCMEYLHTVTTTIPGICRIVDEGGQVSCDPDGVSETSTSYPESCQVCPQDCGQCAPKCTNTTTCAPSTPNYYDFITFVPLGQSSYDGFPIEYVKGAKAGTGSIKVPPVPGKYELVYVDYSTKNIIAKGSAITVNPPKDAVCAADSKQCPDGSSVGRDPANNCNFYQCKKSILNADFANPCPFGTICKGVYADGIDSNANGIIDEGIDEDVKTNPSGNYTNWCDANACTKIKRTCSKVLEDEFKKIYRKKDKSKLEEYIKGSEYFSCPPDDSDAVCCENPNSCVYNGKCYANGSIEDIGNDGIMDMCVVESPGTWVVNYETNCIDGITNDADPLIDCQDPDCDGLPGQNGAICCHSANDCPQDDCVAESCANNECALTSRNLCDSAECPQNSFCNATAGDCKAADESSSVCLNCVADSTLMSWNSTSHIDAGKEYSSNLNVFNSLFNSDALSCPPSSCSKSNCSCFDSSNSIANHNAAISGGNCCGDDPNEYFKKDYFGGECANNASDCVWPTGDSQKSNTGNAEWWCYLHEWSQCDNSSIGSKAGAVTCAGISGNNRWMLNPAPESQYSCNDLKDNDGDGAADCEDSDCYSALQGKVTDGSNSPINGASVIVRKGSSQIASLTTNSQGDYNASSLSCGNYQVSASHYEYSTQSRFFTVNALQQYNIDIVLGAENSCEADCTLAYDETIHASCANINGCTFYDDKAKEICDFAKPGWVRDYNETHYIACASGSPEAKIELKASISCASGTLVKITRIVLYNGEPVKLVVAACG